MHGERVLLPWLGSSRVAREGPLSLLTGQANKPWSPGGRPGRSQQLCSHLLPKSKLRSFLHPICQWAPEEVARPAAAAAAAAAPEQREENKGVKG